MARTDNYAIQVRQAKDAFLGYDQVALIRKCGLSADDSFLYGVLFGREYRICRCSGDISRRDETGWTAADSHGCVMTLLDLICDSREDRTAKGTWRNMTDFGHQFHRSLSENAAEAARFQKNPRGLQAGCLALGGREFPRGDIAFEIPVFEDLHMVLQFWEGDEEFAPRVRYLWDENALQYLKYETMYFAVDLLLSHLMPYL